VGARRDDITGSQRAQIALAILSANRPWGQVSQLAREHGVQRQTIYDIATAGKQLLETGLAPGPHGPHGPQPAAPTIQVNRHRLMRGSVVLTEAGVSQRDVVACLRELLDTSVSLGWVNAVLAHVAALAAAVNARWRPAVGETLAGDEIFSHGQPNLLVVGNDSLYIYALTRQPSCDGDTWGCVLLDAPPCPQLASDAATGLAAGVQEADIAVHQADWDHLLRPLWGQDARLEEQAYAALAAVEQRAAQFDQATTTQRLTQHLAAWERLNAEAEEKITRYDAFHQFALQVDAWFALIDHTSGQLRDPVAGAVSLRQVGQQLREWSGRIYKKLSGYLIHLAEAFFRYQPVLAQALAPLSERWGAPVIQALSTVWQIEADEHRHPQPVGERQAQQRQWAASLDQAVALVGPDQLWAAWEAVSTELGRAWRGSMLAECVNSLLRPLLDGRKQSDQGCLELFRFLHNVRPFARGKRAGHSPAQLVGLDVPDDPLILLGLVPKVSI